MEPPVLQERTVQLRQHRISALETVNPDPNNEWLVFLNGLCLPADFYAEPFLEALSKKFNILAPSINGIDIGGELPTTIDALCELTYELILKEVGTTYHAWGHSTGGTTALLLGRTMHPPLSTRAIQPITPTHTSGAGIHRRCVISSIGAYLANGVQRLARYRDTPETRERLRARQRMIQEKGRLAYANWRSICEKDAGWPILDDIAAFSYQGIQLPQQGHVYLSDRDGLFAPTAENVAQLREAVPNMAVYILTDFENEEYEFTPHHSWPIFQHRIAREILVEDNIPDACLRGPIQNDETLIAPWHWPSLKNGIVVGGLAALITAGVVAYGTLKSSAPDSD